MQTIFREYDIRGIYPNELNEQMVKLIGYFLGQRILKVGKVVSIGYDARSHSPILCENLTSGLNKAGCTVLNMGMVATPVNYFSNFQTFDGLTPNASIMITGSHNPSEYNGFKVTIDKKPFFGEDIYAVGRDIMQHFDMEIEDDLSSTFINAKERYIAYMIKEFDHLKGFELRLWFYCGFREVFH